MYQFVSPLKIYHGEGSISRLKDILSDLKIKSVFLLTDPILKELGVIHPVLQILKNLNINVHMNTNVVPEPPLEVGNQVVDEIRKSRPELVIGIGGGSALDLAKAAAVLAVNDGRVEDFLNLSGTKKPSHQRSAQSINSNDIGNWCRGYRYRRFFIRRYEGCHYS